MVNNNAMQPDQKQGKNNELPVDEKPRNPRTDGTTCCDACLNCHQASTARRDPDRDKRCTTKSSHASHEGSRRRDSGNDRYHNPPPDLENRYNDRYHNSHPPESEICNHCCCDSIYKKPKQKSVKPKRKPQPRDPPPYELSCKRKSLPTCDCCYRPGGPSTSRHAEHNIPTPPPAKLQDNRRRARSVSDCECQEKKRRRKRHSADCATDYVEFRDFKNLAHYSPLVVKSRRSTQSSQAKTANIHSINVCEKSSAPAVFNSQKEVEPIQCCYQSQWSHSDTSLPPPLPPPPKCYPIKDTQGQNICKSSKTSKKHKPHRCHHIGINTDCVGPIQCLYDLSSNGAQNKSTAQSKRGGVSDKENCQVRQLHFYPAGSPCCCKRLFYRSPTEFSMFLRHSVPKRKSLFSSALANGMNNPLPLFGPPLVREISSTPTSLKFFKMRRIPHLNPSCNRMRGGKLTPVNKNIRPGIIVNRTVDVQSTTIIQSGSRPPVPRSSSAVPRRISPKKIKNRARSRSAPPAPRVTRGKELPTTSVKATQRTNPAETKQEIQEIEPQEQKMETVKMQEVLDPPERIIQVENFELPAPSIGLVPTHTVSLTGMEPFYRGSFLNVRALPLDEVKSGGEQPRVHYSSLTLKKPHFVPSVLSSFDRVTDNLRKEFEQIKKSRSSSHRIGWSWIKMFPKLFFNGKKRS